MNLSYQHANPSTGGGSYLLRFGDSTSTRTPCLLVDSGFGVDLDSLLAADEYLAAVVLTHAHLDHYSTLSDSLRDGAPVYAAEPTANVLENVLVEGQKNYEIGAAEDVLDALEPIAGWTTVVPDVEIAPVPVGHAPGAAGYVVRFEDGSRTNNVLVTGDFTARQVAGYPGLQTDLPVDVDALFVNVSTTEGFEETLTDSLFTIVERARAGSSVLVTASGLTGVHYAYLLGYLGEQLGDPVPVTLAGQAAKLYADLDYDVPNVEPVAVFDTPGELLERGTVTLAGPEVPIEGGSRRLFDAIEDDSSATLVQLTGGATNPIESAGCTVYDYEVVNHPEIPVIDELVEEFDPIHVVAGHGPRRVLRDFRGRYDERFVWASSDDREQNLYDDGRWSPPPWLSEPAVQSIRARDYRSRGVRAGDFSGDEDRNLPAVDHGEVDLEAEGLAVERFEERFGGRDENDDPLVAGSTLDDSSSADPAVSNPLTSDSSGTTEPKTALPDGSVAERGVPDSPTSDSPVVNEAETFRTEVLHRLDSLESAVTGTRYEARVVDGGDGVTLLRLMGDDELEHGAEVSVVVTDRDD